MAVAVVTMMAITGTSIIIKRVRAVAALAAVVVLCPRCGFNSGDAQSARTDIAANTTEATRDFFSILLSTTSEQLGGTYTDQSA
jgi:hypothetical protein